MFTLDKPLCILKQCLAWLFALKTFIYVFLLYVYKSNIGVLIIILNAGMNYTLSFHTKRKIVL